MEEKPSVMFYGRYDISLDDKSRLSMPSRLRKQMDGRTSLLLIPGSDGCISGFTEAHYRSFLARIDAASELPSEKVKWYRRHLGEKTVQVTFDKQFRFVLPTALQSHAKIDSDILILGVQERIEFWNPALYETYISTQNSDFDELSLQLGL
jgi:MraZ protein